MQRGASILRFTKRAGQSEQKLNLSPWHLFPRISAYQSEGNCGDGLQIRRQVMKNSITSFLASGLVSSALAIGIALTPSNALAQTSSGVKANIPFAFQVGSRVMPAGTYTFSKQGEHIMLLSGVDAHNRVISMVLPQNEPKAPAVGKVTFAKYGDHYFLHEVSSHDSSTAYSWTTGKQEKELIRELNVLKGTEVAVNVIPNLTH
jgi:hypothetical protein